jgi:diamine N-acetyltransferase
MEPTTDPPRPATGPAPDAVVSLREITRDTVREIVRLKVSPAQERFVATNGMSIAEAHYSPEVAWFRAIYAGEHPVGFVMLEDEPEKQRYFLWRFMIDARYQRLGFGRRALERVIAHVRSRPGATSFGTSCVPGEGGPQLFYEGLGFVDTGVEDDGERVLRLDL